ncbi:MAG TPA: hypothetical protein ENN50_06955 [Prosthecochloris aestuarii]|uniref:Secreted protein n=1 Tax=Prosthecochloris aestuarii TaxID=1102 RepID=A0A831WVR3_PROAE|nr:hypothetical protein [Prosthecochloris aestuarii]
MESFEHKNHNSSRIPVLLLCVVTLLCFRQAFADPPVHIITKKITIDDIRPSDLGFPGSGSMAVNEGSAEFDIMPYGWDAVGSVNTEPELLGPATKVTRRIENLWEWKVLKNKHDKKPDIDVEYRVIGGNGKRDVMTHVIDPTATLPVTLRPYPVTETEKNNQWIFSGAAEIEMDFADIKKSGNYEGEIEIRITIAP